MKLPGNDAVFLIDNGYRRWIPDQDTYLNLFLDWSGIYESNDFSVIPIGQQLASNSAIISTPTIGIYLVEGGVRRWIVNPDVFNYWHFHQPTFQIDDQSMERYPKGTDIENSMACYTRTSQPEQGSSISLMGSSDAISGFDEYQISVPLNCMALSVAMLDDQSHTQPSSTYFVLTAPDGTVYNQPSTDINSYVAQTSAATGGIVNFYNSNPASGVWTVRIVTISAEAFWLEAIVFGANGKQVYEEVINKVTENAPMARDALQSIVGDSSSPEFFEQKRKEYLSRRGSASITADLWSCFACRVVLVAVAAIILVIAVVTLSEASYPVILFVQLAARLGSSIAAATASSILRGLTTTVLGGILQLICQAINLC